MNRKYRPAGIISLFVVTSLAATARANDSSFSGVGGTIRPMKGEHSTVRMVREKIAIEAYRDYYDTTVDFVFHNTGAGNIATMGFPEGNYGDGYEDGPKKQTQFLTFKTWVDGKPVVAKRTILRTPTSDGTDVFWIKVVPFARMQTRKVRVHYRSRYGGVADVSLIRAINYAFTGQNWKGKVDRSDLVITLHNPGTWIVTPYWGYKVLPMTAQGGRFSKTWRHWEAQGTFLLGTTRTDRLWLMDSQINGLLSQDARSASRTVTVPGRVSAGKDGYDPLWTPHGVMRNGIAFVSLDNFRNRLNSIDGRNLNTIVDWQPKTRSAHLTSGKLDLVIATGSKVMQVSGAPNHPAQRNIDLGTAAFQQYGTLYVPLAPLARAIGATARVDAGRHSLTLNFPKNL